jgi:hypothetical protein
VTDCSHVHCEAEATALVHLVDTREVLVRCEEHTAVGADGQEYGPVEVVRSPQGSQQRLADYGEA